MTDANPAADEILEEKPSSKQLEENLKSRPTWVRFLFMAVFAIAFYLAAIVGTFVVVIGFLFRLFTGETNEKLRDAGQVLATYVYDIARYLTYNTDTRPFPFDSDLRQGDQPVE